MANTSGWKCASMRLSGASSLPSPARRRPCSVATAAAALIWNAGFLSNCADKPGAAAIRPVANTATNMAQMTPLQQQQLMAQHASSMAQMTPQQQQQMRQVMFMQQQMAAAARPTVSARKLRACDAGHAVLALRRVSFTVERAPACCSKQGSLSRLLSSLLLAAADVFCLIAALQGAFPAVIQVPVPMNGQVVNQPVTLPPEFRAAKTDCACLRRPQPPAVHCLCVSARPPVAP